MIRNIVMANILIISIVIAYVLMIGNSVSQPVKQKIEKTIVVKGGEGTYSYQADITAYSGEIDQTDSDPGKTALMETPVVGGTCAVSQDLQRYLGMRVYIEGNGVYRVNDLMNERYKKRIDLFVGSREKAKKFGKKEDAQVVFFRSK